MTKKRLDLVINTKVEGHESAIRKIREYVKAQESKVGIENLKAMYDFTKMMGVSTGKLVATMKHLKREFQDLGNIAKRMQKDMLLGDRESGGAKRSPARERTGFWGRTMSYAAGNYVYDKGKSLAQGLASTAGGSAVEGLGQALGGIPVIGGSLAGMFGTGMSAAKEAMEQKRLLMNLRQFGLGRGGGLASLGGNLKEDNSLLTTYIDAALEQNAQYHDISVDPVPRHTKSTIIRDQPLGGMKVETRETNLSQEQMNAIKTSNMNVLADNVARIEQDLAREQDAKRANRNIEDAKRTYGGAHDFAQGAFSYGMNSNDALKFAAQFMGARGATASTNQLNTAAALSNVGIGANISGAFSRAGRLGYGSEEDLGMLFNQAESLGLGGTDVVRYLEQMSNAMLNFENTGMKLDVSSVAKMGRFLKDANISSIRSAAIGQNLGGFLQSSSQRMPESALDIQILKAYGFTGSLESFNRAQELSESGQITPEVLGALRDMTLTGAGEEEGLFAVKNLLRQMGMSATESRKFAQALSGGDLSALEGDKYRVGTSISGLLERGKAPIELQDQKKIETQRISEGDKLVTAMLNLEKTNLKMLEGFTSFSEGLTRYTELVLKNMTMVSEGIIKMSEILPRLDSIVSWVVR